MQLLQQMRRTVLSSWLCAGLNISRKSGPVRRLGRVSSPSHSAGAAAIHRCPLAMGFGRWLRTIRPTISHRLPRPRVGQCTSTEQQLLRESTPANRFRFGEEIQFSPLSTLQDLGGGNEIFSLLHGCSNTVYCALVGRSGADDVKPFS